MGTWGSRVKYSQYIIIYHIMGVLNVKGGGGGLYIRGRASSRFENVPGLGLRVCHILWGLYEVI